MHSNRRDFLIRTGKALALAGGTAGLGLAIHNRDMGVRPPDTEEKVKSIKEMMQSEFERADVEEDDDEEEAEEIIAEKPEITADKGASDPTEVVDEKSDPNEQQPS